MKYNIKNISNENQGKIKINKDHYFIRGDFIQIENISGMDEISNEEIRPICSVLSS